MKKETKILSILIMIIVFILFFKTDVRAASASISANKTTINLGETVTITTTIKGASWNVSLSGSVSQGYADTTDDAENGTKVYTYSFKPTSAGTYTIKLTGEVTDSNYQKTPISSSVQINVIKQDSGGSSSGSNSNSSSGNSSQTDSKPAEKSSNANLSNLGIKPNDFTGFKSGTTTYNVTVPNEVDSVEVYATKADSKAKITGTGTKSLQEGENALSVVVTAENGNTKTYTINVTREAAKEEENTEEETEVKKGLSSISINNLELNPEFATDVYEYTVKYIGEETSLDITTVPTDANYKTEILGNEELKEGENIVTILVTDAEGNNIATYQLIVNKELKAEVVENTEEKTTNDDFQKMIVIAGGIAVLIIILILIIIIRHKRNKAYAEEFSGVPFSKLKDEDEDYENELDERKRAKKEFLSGFDDNQDVIEEKVKRNKKKGKRFK